MITRIDKPFDETTAGLVLPPIGKELSKTDAQKLAEQIALTGLGRVSPNPLVGAVIVDTEHKFLGAGAHLRVGDAHAEVNAVEQVRRAGAEARLAGATAYVTLEPCSHQGRTGSCAVMLAGLPLAKVVYGVQDPNPQVDGKGAAILAKAGITAEHDPGWQAACEQVAECFLWQVRTGKPFVALKAAVGLDGTLAHRGDRRFWITGSRARSYGHFLRVKYDAIAVGSKTVLLDNPTLDCRDSLVTGDSPKRIVLDPELEGFGDHKPDQLKILQHEPGHVFWVATESAWNSPKATSIVAGLDRLGVKRLSCPIGFDGRFDLDQLLKILTKDSIQSLLLEGGAGLYGGFLDAGLVQKIHLFQAPKIFGGADLIRWTDGCRRGRLPAWSQPSLTPLENDWHIEATVEPDQPD